MKILIIIILTFFSTSLCKFPKSVDCNPFAKTNKYLDTIDVKVELIEMIKLPRNDLSLIYLEKKKLLKANAFKSDIKFKIIGCKSFFNLVCRENSDKGGRILNSDYPKKATLKCVVYKDKKIPYSDINGNYAIIISVDKYWSRIVIINIDCIS